MVSSFAGFVTCQVDALGTERGLVGTSGWIVSDGKHGPGHVSTMLQAFEITK